LIEHAMEHAPPVLWIIAGPNGAGKSTYHDEYVSQVFRAPFVNADRIAHRLWGRHPADEAEMRAAAEIAERKRNESLAARRSFVAESVFSHASKLALMRDALARGYYVRLSFVCVDGPALCALRVQGRVAHGGHGVPLHKIAARYARSLEHAKDGVRLAHWAVVLDNTSIERPHRPVLHYAEGELRWRRQPLPGWVEGFPGL
jgi:predicted ABC-type ATPase